MAGCKSEAPGGGRLLEGDAVGPLTQSLVADRGLAALDVSFDGRLALIGAKVEPAQAGLGQTLEGTLVWKVEDAPGDAPDLKVFVHAIAPGGAMPLAQADHAINVGTPSAQWKDGDVLVDTFALRLPKTSSTDRLEIRVGLYEGKHRWPVDRGTHDGDNRVGVASIEVAGGDPAFPVVRAPKRQAPVVIDGVLDDADWARAQRVGPFVNYSGKGKMKHPTWARLLWDDEALYIGFECDDPDIHTPYTKRDDPLYNSEAVEIFIDADGDKDEYVELQAAPNDLHFDAAFKGGARQGFDTSWDHTYETKAKLEGTLNDDSDKDTRWVSEWRIPIAGLKDLPAPPKAGTEWKINLFRLDRIRRNGKVRGSEASAWSSPYSGDFHNLNRFGTLLFTE